MNIELMIEKIVNVIKNNSEYFEACYCSNTKNKYTVFFKYVYEWVFIINVNMLNFGKDNIEVCFRSELLDKIPQYDKLFPSDMLNNVVVKNNDDFDNKLMPKLIETIKSYNDSVSKKVMNLKKIQINDI